MSRAYIANRVEDLAKLCYDYEKQAWIKNGVYVRCGHPEHMSCNCYGRIHAGEQAWITAECH